MAEIKLVHVPGKKPIRILKWLVKKGEPIQHGTPLAVYRIVEEPAKQTDVKELQLKSKHVGTVKKFFMQEGQVAISEGVLLEIEGCAHPVVMKDMCAECGQDLRPLQEQNAKRQKRKIHSAKVAMIPSIPELRISAKEAEEIALQDKNRLHQMKKLVLLVDLDQTLIHTTQDPGLAALCQSNEDFYSFQLSKNDPMLFTKLRPHCREFLQEVSRRYELQIVTFGSRQYAHKIADFIDKEKKYFAHRILSRDECIHPFKKSGNLRHLFPCGDSMVCIIDDRDDVWNAVPNLIMVRKYNYFQGTGDINTPYKDKDKVQDGESSSSANSNRKRKSDEELGGGDNGVKRLKDEPSPSVQQTVDDVTMLDSNDNKIQEDSKSEVDDDLNLSSDSESSSDSTSDSSSSENSDNEDSQPPNEEHFKNTETGVSSSENAPTTKESDITTADKTDLSEQPSTKNGELKETVAPVIPEKTNGDGNDADGNRSSLETQPMSSQESMAQNSQESIDRDMSGLSRSSQEFTQDSVIAGGDGKTVRDLDDYLPFLKDILVQIHETYYEAYEKYTKKEFDSLPDVRGVVPFLRSKVLYGMSFVFTGIIPQTFHLPHHCHRAHVVARQLGARVEEQVTDETTHLIAAKRGTTKYQEAEKRKKQGIKMVSVDWLWCCSERWEHVEERLFPVPNKFVESSNKCNVISETESSSSRQAAKSGSTVDETNEKIYHPSTGKLMKKVPDARLNFKLAESQLRRQEEKTQMPVYSSLQVPNAIIPIQPIKSSSNKLGSSKHLPLAKSNTTPGYVAGSRSRKRSMAEVMGYQYSLSTDDIADMDKEVDDLLESSDEDAETGKDEKPAALNAINHVEEDSSQTSPELESMNTDESLGTMIEKLPESPKPNMSDSEKGEESDDEAEDGEESSEDDEMEALLNAEMHFNEEEDNDV